MTKHTPTIQRWLTFDREWHKSDHGDWVQWDDVKKQREQDFRLLASAMRKVLPPSLLQEVIIHLDPLTPFIEYLKETEDD